MKTKHSTYLQGFKIARSHTRLLGVWHSRYVPAYILASLSWGRSRFDFRSCCSF